MASDGRPVSEVDLVPGGKRLDYRELERRVRFEWKLRLWLYTMGLPALLLGWLLLRQLGVRSSFHSLALVLFAAAWGIGVSWFVEQVVRPLRTLTNVVAAMRKDDYSFRARGGQRNDALGDLALEINGLAQMLKDQREGAIEAMALVESVMGSMQSPVVAFDSKGELKLVNAAGERAFGLVSARDLNRQAGSLALSYLLKAADDEILPLGNTPSATRWVVKRTGFRLQGVPHTLLVLSDVSVALREEERQAWERLIRVLGHEISNSLTPIKSIAGSLRGRLAEIPAETGKRDDFDLGLDVIENRADSLNRFLQAYKQLMGLPAPRPVEFLLATLVERVAKLETRIDVTLIGGPAVSVTADPDQLQQALINLVRNAAEAALSPDAAGIEAPEVEVEWSYKGREVTITIRDNGLGLMNETNLFVPFYTTKPGGNGIGLVLAQQVAQAHRGNVRLRNRGSGVGCEVEFRIEVSRDQSLGNE